MTILLEVQIFSLYSQVALIDAQAKSAYPEWQTGDDIAILGHRGIVIATKGDIYLDVAVIHGGINSSEEALISGQRGWLM